MGDQDHGDGAWRERAVPADAAAGQVSLAAAEVYEAFFVPALFGQWPDRLLDAAGVQLGTRVLDVGCGTGVLARAAADRVGEGGHVAALDVNAGMLAVARRAPARVDWRQGSASDLPWPDGSFDHAMSQFALMFVDPRSSAVPEMARVTRPGGTVTVATWCRIEESPGYAAMVELLDRLFGGEVAAALLAPFTIGAAEELRAEMVVACEEVDVRRVDGTARFASIDDWVRVDVRGWTLADLIDDQQFAELLAAARTDLRRFAAADGRVEFPAPALVGVGTA